MHLRSFRRTTLSVSCFFVLLLSSAAFPPAYASASSSPITVISRSAITHFPSSIDFSITVRDSSSPIIAASITITFDVPGYREKSSSNQATINNPASTETVNWHQDTTGDNFYPAGTKIIYYWQLRDNAGNLFTDTTQQFRTIDTRFAWQTLSQGFLQVHWYSRPLSFGQFILNKASSDIAHISVVLGSGLLHSINLWVYQNDQDFHGSLPPGSYEWVGGEAFPSLDEASIVVATDSDTTLLRDMPHELTHLVFHQLVEPSVQIPTWFDEGLAVYNQLYHEPDMNARLQAALDSHTLLRLDDISFGFPADADQAYLAYAQSWNLVSYMYSTFGRPRLRAFIRTLRSPNATFDQDLQQTLGEDQAHLENQWRISLHQSPTLASSQSSPKPTTASKNQPGRTPAQASIDSTSVLLLTLGISLVLLSLVSLSLITLNINRRKRQAMTIEAAQQLMAANAARWPQNYQSSTPIQDQQGLYRPPRGQAPQE